jgi:hypothetical protein
MSATSTGCTAFLRIAAVTFAAFCVSVIPQASHAKGIGADSAEALNTFYPHVGAKVTERWRVPFDSYASTSCTGNYTECYLQLYDVPNKRRLYITHMSCRARLNTAGVLHYVGIYRLGSGYSDHIAPEGPNDGVDFSTDASVSVYVEAGDSAFVQAQATRDLTWLECRIAGELAVLK